MTWYYAVGQEQKGPVTEAQLHALAKDGAITAATLVWRDGMADWQPYSTVAGDAAGGASAAPTTGVQCAECSRSFPPDQVVRFGDRFVCAACKPTYVQRLQEGAVKAGPMDYASFGARFGAKLIDGILMQVVGAVIGFVVGVSFSGAGGGQPNPAMFAIIWPLAFGAEILYKTLFTGALGATPGKLALNLRVVNPDGSKVGYGKACGRAFAEFLSGIICAIGYIMAGFDDERRALHDRICETRVIKVG